MTTPAKGNNRTFDRFSLDKSLTPPTLLNGLTFVPAGYQLLYQPEVVRVYTSLLKESKNPTVLEASAGAVQNLCAGRWTVRAKTVIENKKVKLFCYFSDLKGLDRGFGMASKSFWMPHARLVNRIISHQCHKTCLAYCKCFS